MSEVERRADKVIENLDPYLRLALEQIKDGTQPKDIVMGLMCACAFITRIANAKLTANEFANLAMDSHGIMEILMDRPNNLHQQRNLRSST